MHNFIYRYKKERNFKQYDSVISIRLSKDFYTFLHKINPINISLTLRSLIRADLYEGEIEITQKEIRKMFNTFYLEDSRKEISEYTYKRKKTKHLNIRLYESEKREIIRRSDNNINNYIDLLIMEFINNISDKHEKYRWG